MVSPDAATPICWPDTEHPAYAGELAEIIRGNLHNAGFTIPITRRPALVKDTSGEFAPTITRAMELSIVTMAGPAPWAGRRCYCYSWRVAIDEVGRWVAGPARLEPMEWFHAMRLDYDALADSSAQAERVQQILDYMRGDV